MEEEKKIETTEVAAEVPEAKAKDKSVIRKAKKSKNVRQVSQGCVYIRATYNNTLITVTDAQGNTLAWSSAGHLGFKGPKKATPYAAGIVVKNLAEKLEPIGIRDLYVYIQGVGSGREAAIRGLNAQGFNVTGIKDITPIPHNGCRAPRPRRV